MTPDRWQQVKDLFYAALERDATQRAAYLGELCAGDPDLRSEVESLLAYDEREASFLTSPLSEIRATVADGDAMAGRGVGPYQLVREVGRGGMGAVYLASRADGHFQKQVAVKLLKRGMDTDAILRRFHQEQQVLATLDHPNIVKLLDAGLTDDGRSYFIMDYVEGLPIDGYCDTHTLPTVERLTLFRAVCAAVAYAHDHHVVHRDLKPSNILVTGEGVPKLLDFGIAKLLTPELAVRPGDSTATALRPMTPEYASPEQVRGEPITPASDIYALGVLLYELLTGHRPYRLERRTPPEIERVICEEVPEKPSTVVSRVEEVHRTDGEAPLKMTPESVSATRDGRPETLRRRLAGDLDTIVLMALRKEPERRYASVEQFSEDIRRHLKGLPVRARRDTLVYRGAKFLGRNRRAVIAAGLASAVVLTLTLLASSLVLRRDVATPHATESIAVLPLANLSGDPEQEYFADGMTETLISALAQIKSLRVISPTSVMRYRKDRKPLPQIARELNVGTVVEGSVLRSGDRVRIMVQLIHAATDQHLWAKTYDRDVRDVLALQTDVAREIAQEIKVKLTPQEQVRLTSARPVNREAYEAYLKGRYFWNEGTGDGFTKAIEHFEHAIKLDPTYALAYAWLADAFAMSTRFRIIPQAYAKAKAAALRALELDGELAKAHVALGEVNIFYDRDWAAAEENFKRAIALEANEARTHHAYAIGLTWLGKFDEAMREIQRGRELDPVSPAMNAGAALILYCARRYDQAISEARKALDLDPNFPQAHRFLGKASVEKGLYDEAIAAFRKGIASGGPALLKADLGHAYAVSGQRSEALKILNELKDPSKRKYGGLFDVAILYVGLGDADRALEWLEKSYAERERHIVTLKVTPVFDPLRSDPRFADLLRRVGLWQ